MTLTGTMEKITLENDVKALHNHEAFARFIKQVYADREQRMSELRDRDPDQVMQLSGEITYAHDILELAKWDELRARHAGRL